MIIDLGKVAITAEGNWKNNKSYAALTIIVNAAANGGDGCGYVSLKDNIGVRPGTDPVTWQKCAEAGQSIYDLCKARGYAGTEDQFVAEYNAAVAAANAAAASASAAEARMAAAESGRVSAENARATAENARASAEDARVAAENARAAAETSRAAAETLRANTFSQQSAAMTTALNLADTATAAANSAAAAATSAAEAAAAAATAASNYAERVAALEAAKTRILRDLGYRDAESEITLTLGVSGKYVKCSTRQATANANFNISEPFDVDACAELLIKTGFNPSDNDHASLDISVISLYEEIERQRVVQKKDGNNQPLYYVVVVDPETGQETVTTDETTTNTGYPVYVTETYTEQQYLPNNEDRYVQIPDSGYYIANIPQSCKCVISYKPGLTDMTVLVVKHGALANLTSQIFGIYEHRTMAEAVAQLAERVEALEDSRGLLGDATAGKLDVSELRKCLYPVVLKGHGAPGSSVIPVNLPEGLPWDGVPSFVGQLYINLDAASGGLYYAKGASAVADWINA